MTTKKSEIYGTSEIKAPDDITAIRTRPGMYIGSTEDPRQLLSECMDNSIDEELAGYSKKMVVQYDSATGKIRVRDYGRGIPIGKVAYTDSISKKKYNVEALELLFMKSHSGGKFGGKAYKFSRGLHGVGNKTICALSEEAEAITIRKKKSVVLKMKKGKTVSLSYKKTEEPDGMIVEFLTDKEIFDSAKTPIEAVKEICSIPVAFGLHVELEIDGETVPSKYNSLFDLLPKDSGNEFFRTTFGAEKNDNPIASMNIAVICSSETDTVFRGYTNMLLNSMGGSHVRFFESVWEEAWKKYQTDGFKLQDTLLGLRAVVGASVDNSLQSYSSQTKEKLTTQIKHFEHFRKPLVKQIQKFFDTHKEEREGLIRRFTEYRQSRNNMMASKELSQLIYVNDAKEDGKVRRLSVVSKLKECSSHGIKGTRCYIVEGDSAAGTYVQCRDKKLHAILPIRGKILNVSKKDIDIVKCMQNAEVRSIVNAAGTGIGEACDASLSRYESYFISPDSDSDGDQIACLVASIFVNLLPALVKAGMVYIVRVPLYGWTDERKVRRYTDNLEEVGNLSTLTRYKGLGEFDPDELFEVCVKNPHLIRLDYPDDIDAFNEIMMSPKAKFDLLMERGRILEFE